jgi:hypothetical protein
MEVKLVYGDTLRQKSYAVVAAKGNIPEVTPKLMPACHQSMFTDVDELKSHPFDLSYRLSADYNFVYNLYKRGEKMLYIPVNISFCEAVYGVSSVNKIAVKKECARIRGVDHTLTWKIKILGKQVEYGIKQIIEYLIPASFLKEMKIRNRKRLEHRK